MKCSSDTIQARARQAHKSLGNCRLCARRCGVDRLHGPNGHCGLGPEARCFREMLHPAEETCLNPSHQVYFSGCNLHCEYCSVLEWVDQPLAAEPMDKPSVLAAIAQRRDQGARTLNLLGGEPTVNLPDILDLLADVPGDTTVVWNSNMYFDDSTLDLLDGIVDLYLADFKCGNATCAEHLLGAEDYVEVIQNCLTQASQRSDMIVRHTPMPGHWDCCTVPILTWLGEHLPQVRVSLRFDYIPPATARYASLDYGTRADQERSLHLAHELGLELVT